MHLGDPLFPSEFHEPVAQVLRAARSDPSVPVIDHLHEHPLRGRDFLGNEELYCGECAYPDFGFHNMHKWNPCDIQEDIEAS